MLPLRFTLLAAAVASASCRAPEPASDAGTVHIDRPQSRSGGEGPEPPERVVEPAIGFEFPLAEYVDAIDAGEDRWSGIIVKLDATRSSEDRRDELSFQLRGDHAQVTTRSVESQASSARYVSGDAEPFRLLLRACARRTTGCRVGPLDQDWTGFELRLSLSHGRLGHTDESPEAAELLLPLIERLLEPKPPKTPD